MHLLRPLVAVLAAAGFVAGAHAASVRVTFDTPIFAGVPAPHSDAVTITFPAAGGSGSQSLSVAAGRFQGTASNVTGVDPSIFVDGLDDLLMYCYDVYERVGNGWVVDYTIDFDGETARTLDFLGAVNAVLNQGQATPDPYAWLHPSSGFMAAAIQLGIWESRYDDGAWNLGTGSFRAAGAEAQTLAHLSSFFAAVPGAPALDGRFVMTLAAGGAQDMITGDPPVGVPEPGTLALAAAALLAGARRLRRR